MLAHEVRYPIRRVLFPVDFSERCTGAAHYVAAIAGRLNAEVILLHVAMPPYGAYGPADATYIGGAEEYIELARRMGENELAEYLREETASLNVRRLVRVGLPAEQIVEVARAEQVDLIMMPTHGRGGFRRFLLGSIAAKVLDDAPCPVWTGTHLEEAPPVEAIGVRQIVCAVDLNEEGVNVLRFASKLAHDTGAAIRLVHALPPVRLTDLVGADEDLLEGLREAVRADIGRMMERAGLRAPVDLEFGEVPQTIRCAARNHQADLVIVGRKQEHPHGGFLRAHGYAIVREAPCPVLSL